MRKQVRQKPAIALYMRLSLADTGRTAGMDDESGSIRSQRQLLMSYLRDREEFTGCRITEYVDDGISGTVFEGREAFSKMINDVREGEISCIIVKDFSRAGRDYLEVGNYLELVFPAYGVRFISVNDNYDSIAGQGMTGGMSVAFRNLVYQMYSRDLSKKVKTARRNRNRNGEYTASYAPFGYRKDEADKHKLVIDPYEAATVKRIFELYGDGVNGNEIARMLNREQIPTRAQRQREKCHYVPAHDHGDNLWSGAVIHEILKNPVYKGVLVQNRWETQGFGDSKKMVRTPEDRQSVAVGAVPRIVDDELFEGAAARSKRIMRKRKRSVNLFVCPFCGRKLRLRHSQRLYCSVREQMEGSSCGTVDIAMERAEDLVMDTVREMAALAMDASKNDKGAAGLRDGNGNMETIQSLEREISAWEDAIIRAYNDYANGVTARKDFMRKRDAARKKIRQNEEKMEHIKSQTHENQILASQRDALMEAAGLDEFDADRLSGIIREIRVYDPDHVDVVFHGDDLFQHH